MSGVWMERIQVERMEVDRAGADGTPMRRIPGHKPGPWEPFTEGGE